MFEKVYVYLIHSETDHINQYKIGISKHPENRIKELKTANPNIVGVVDKYLCDSREIAHKVETWFHKYYRIFNIDGEWFMLDENELIDFTNNCKIFEARVKTHLEIEKNLKEKDIEDRLWR